MVKNNKVLFSVIVIVALGGSYLLFGRGSSKSQVQYVTSAAEKGTLTASVSGSGNVVVDKIATVDPTITGTVADLSVKVGDSVKKGQLLFKIENDQLGVSVSKAWASYQQALNNLESAKVSKKQAQADLNAAKSGGSTSGGGSGNSAQTVTTKATYTKDQIKVLEEKVKLADSSINVAEQNVSAVYEDYLNQQSIAAKRTVTAPIAGIVNQVNIKNGDDLGKTTSSVASTGSSSSSTGSSSSSSSSKQSPIVIGDLGTIKAQVSVNEVDIPNVKVGQKTTLKFDALEGVSLTGKVEKIDSLGTVSQGVVTYNVTIAFDSSDIRVKPEMSVSATIITKVKHDVIIIANSALKSDGENGHYVQVLRGKTPVRRVVEVGLANTTETEIISGLEEGEKVITQTVDPNATTTSGSSGQRGMFMGSR
ncbi:MAG: HlyD family efflux transporter periplasmic adaptor subunit [Actinobacteria bacterium]|nr:MAG: HlyD family efflux transporter periplasmic adaptor subunit [Actinomycetota bacterium]